MFFARYSLSRPMVLFACCALLSGATSSTQPKSNDASRNQVAKTVRSRKPEWCLQQVMNPSGKPVIILSNLAYRNFENRGSSPYLIHINITIMGKSPNGLPTSEENEVLNALEDDLLSALMIDETTHFIGKATSDGFRELVFYAPEPKKRDAELKAMLKKSKPIRSWEYRISLDREWKQANQLIGDAPECL